MRRRIFKIALFGIQGAGKGTQGKHITEIFGIPSVSPGTMFRKEVKEETELGKFVRPYLEAGKLVPDDITNAMMRERLSRGDCKKGYILDGYPRDEEQMKFLEANETLTHVLSIEIPDEDAVARIASRRACSRCGAKYNLIVNPPKQKEICDACGGALEMRSDDRPEAVRERLRIYHAMTEPLLQFYKKKGILHRLDGKRDIEGVWKEIEVILASETV